MNDTRATGPLDGIVVIEHATVLMGPLTGQILGDLGATVIKVEGEKIDASRLMGAGPLPELSGVALNLHRNKRSMQLDLKRPAAMRVMVELVSRADVFLTNMRPGALRRLALDYETLRSANQALVYCECHGYRSDSEEAERPAYDDVMQAETGLPMLQNRVGLGVSYIPSVVADKVAGVTAAYGVMAALLHRARTGEGQRVEVPMFDSALAFNLTEHLAAAAIKGAPAGYTRILTEHRRPHRTSDGYLSVLPYSDQQWLDIFAAVGRSEQLDHPAFADRFSRNQNSGFVYAKLGEAIALRSTSEWMDVCLKHDIPAAAVPELDDLVEDPAKNRGVLVEADHPVIGKYRQIRPPVIFDGSPSSVRRHAPLIGEHTVEILAEIGLDEDEIDQMLESGAATQAWVPQLIGLLVHIPG